MYDLSMSEVPGYDPEKQADSFDTKFEESSETIKLPDRQIDIVDIKPEYPKSDIPVLIAPGYAETTEIFKGSTQIIYEEDREVIALNHPRHIDKRMSSADISDSEEAELPQVALDRATDLLDIIESKNLDKVDVIAHSQGGIDVAIAASIQPEKFRNIVFVDPGGMIGQDTLPRLLGRFSKKMIHDSYLQRKEGLKYMAENPARALKEGIAISQAEIDQMLLDLKASGIGIIIIHGVDDPVFPMERVQQVAETEMLDGFLSVKGEHDELHKNPAQYTKAAEEMITALEKKETK